MKTSVYLSEKTVNSINQIKKTDGRLISLSGVIRYAIQELAKKYGLTES